ncbi:MAG: tRNA 5-hydroxyuridine modification protein YegQ [Calditrichaceae bacterium]|nr:tRNA 5-hydroxyuridine modification protein YegQ [Calditrichaceae bacterium]MBN2707826.1 tRNA 5-hydroxyuridine modification protein YegQ [Calditrichaceae bacterium]RQV94893.1 MAG: U32 family peptidase [Calditrichota bacterium]
MRIPELLSPAGGFEKMEYALAYGADAVYAGIPRFSLRVRENDFKTEKLYEAVEYVHQRNKKIYLTMNIYPHNRKVDSFIEILDIVAQMNADGLIMADPGMIAVAREKYPQLNIHLSTQSNSINWQTVKFWKSIGLKRIILSRELSIDEIAEIKQKAPDIELETFIHGAVCIAYSGRCLLSNYFAHRDANQGACTNACRWQYRLYEGTERKTDDESEPYEYFLEETERPGQLMPIDEDEHGTYIMNAKDLSAIHIINRLIDAGIDSLKIEGRTKSLYYLSVITGAYRKAIDAWASGQKLSNEILDEVYAVANRGYVTGFLEKNPLENGQNYLETHAAHPTHRFVGIVRSWDKNIKQAKIAVRNRFKAGDHLQLFNPESQITFKVENIYSEAGETLEAAHGGGQDVYLPVNENPGQYALLRKITNYKTDW